MQINWTTCTAQELADAARAGYAMHSENTSRGFGVALLGRVSGGSAGTYHIFELAADVETTLDAANTDPERLLAHARGFLANRQHHANRVARANEYGYETGVEGGSRKDNGFAQGCAEWKAWEAGFDQGAQVRREIANGA